MPPQAALLADLCDTLAAAAVSIVAELRLRQFTNGQISLPNPTYRKLLRPGGD